MRAFWFPSFLLCRKVIFPQCPSYKYYCYWKCCKVLAFDSFGRAELYALYQACLVLFWSLSLVRFPRNVQPRPQGPLVLQCGDGMSLYFRWHIGIPKETLWRGLKLLFSYSAALLTTLHKNNYIHSYWLTGCLSHTQGGICFSVIGTRRATK